MSAFLLCLQSEVLRYSRLRFCSLTAQVGQVGLQLCCGQRGSRTLSVAAVERNNLLRLATSIPFTPASILGNSSTNSFPFISLHDDVNVCFSMKAVKR